MAGSATVFAQSEPLEQVQVLNGSIDGADDLDQYRMENLRQGDSVFVHVQGLSGNLDPFIALLSIEQQASSRAGEFYEEVEMALANNRDPLLVVSEFADRNFLTWDDDSGGGFSAAFEFVVQSDGDYVLLVLSSPFTESFGDYRLTVGLNAPQALSGNATSKGGTFVNPASSRDTRNAAVQENRSNSIT